MERNANEWQVVLKACGVDAATAAVWGPVFADEIHSGSFSRGDLDIVDWLPEILHESAMLTAMVENLNYASTALVPLFGPTRITQEQADKYGRNSQHAADQRALANILYGGAWGLRNLGNTLPDDGWTFRGRTPIGLTGRANYERTGLLVGQNLVGIPDLAAQPRFALDICIAWWEDKIPDSMLGETTSIRRRVNGGALGLADVQRLTVLARKAIDVRTA